jgi:hypothetical protein
VDPGRGVSFIPHATHLSVADGFLERGGQDLVGVDPLRHRRATRTRIEADECLRVWFVAVLQPISFADIGRLMVWVDDLRPDYAYTREPITEISLLLHEDLAALATGYVPDSVLDASQTKWKELGDETRDVRRAA